MHVRSAFRAVLTTLLLVAVLAFAAVGAAEDVVVAPELDGVEHHWVREQMAYLPYTEPAVAERDAQAAAVAALADPMSAIAMRGTHDYQDAGPFVAMTDTLKSAEPRIVGHELIVWNDERAARVYVSGDGVMTLLDSGTPREILPTSSLALTDAGDLDAYEIARKAIATASGLAPGVDAPVGGLVTAHAVGFAADDGTHVVTRVDVDENVSFPDW